MIYIPIIGFILLLIFLFEWSSKKRKQKKLLEKLKSNWGKPKANTYFNFSSIDSYFQNTKHKEKSFHYISNRISNDLDIDEIFKFIDRTTSKIGQQFLYTKIRTIESTSKLSDFEKLTQVFLRDSNLRLNCQILLSKLDSFHAYDLERLITETTIPKPFYHKFLLPLSIAACTCIILGFIYPIFFLLLILIFAINILFHYKNKNNITYYINAVRQLKKSLDVSKSLIKHKEIQSHFKDITFIKHINKIKNKTAFIGFEKSLSGDITDVFWFVSELVKIQFNLETIIFYKFIDSITDERQQIDKLFRFIGEIDSAISTASLRSGMNKVCQPNFTNNNITIEKIYHPLIENCITNDLELNQKSLLLTGSNMSGKTTFIRTIAINSILAQTLNICFATQFSAPFFKLFSSIRISDDLKEDTSYYLKEVLTIKELISASDGTEACLFVLDEIFKGTNTVERISGGKAILSHLNRKNHFVLVSTHDIELADLLVKDHFELYHFSEKVNNDELIFDHKLKKGKLTTRNAIKILELYDYPTSIILEAHDIENSLK